MAISIKPLGNRLVVEPIEQEEVTAGGIVLAEGDTVLFAKYSGTEIKYDGKKLLIMRESDILAKLNA